MLERLGMRSRVTRSAVLQSARSIEELAASDAPAAARRARALLRYVDSNAEAIPADPLPPLPRFFRRWLPIASAFSAAAPARCVARIDSRMRATLSACRSGWRD